jgi:glutamate/tyrosine decarboxylase-like PLP-dependent enzyme
VREQFWPTDPSLIDDLLAWSRQRILGPTDPNAGARPAGELDRAFGASPVTPAGVGGAEAMRLFTEVVVPATRAQGDPLNLAYVPSAPTQAALAFDGALSAAGIFAGTWEAGAGAVHAENQALAWLASLAGWPPTAGGVFVAGGTMGNLSALAAARCWAEDRHGRPRRRWRVAATAEAHSSIRTAARLLDAEVLAVPADRRGRMTGAALARVLDGDDRDGLVAVAVSGGTTNAGVVDDLAGIARVCDGSGLWLHVDGAYGAAALCAPSARGLFDGIERADSFIVDPHKWLFAPYDCCALLYRVPERAVPAFRQTASYLDQIDRQAWNPSDYAAHLSRRARGLPLWFSLATYGTDRFAAAVERTLGLARAVAGEIRRRAHLELVMEPELSVVLFRRPGWSEDRLQGWSSSNARNGVVLCVPTRWAGEAVLRLCFVNPETPLERVTAVLDSLA